MASPYGCGESSKKGSLHGVIEKLPFEHYTNHQLHWARPWFNMRASGLQQR